eukprot:CAMPEP_0116023186 /NCGR_PEP_ID=MMETSP0321-20121206/11438_1 /TAXON_ID=163516 /ORGANISM="Leptocylindrus danicus var. danicus, Strain B650" /LENGTH=38 /DNA_ID= /DNA_START= /DNA_END= /DNA_ORIENTATION=
MKAFFGASYVADLETAPKTAYNKNKQNALILRKLIEII